MHLSFMIVIYHSPTMQAYNLTCAHYTIIYPLIKLDFSLILVSLFLSPGFLKICAKSPLHCLATWQDRCYN